MDERFFGRGSSRKSELTLWTEHLKKFKTLEASLASTVQSSWGSDFDNQDVPPYLELTEHLEATYQPDENVKRVGGLALFAASKRSNETVDVTTSLKGAINSTRGVVQGWAQMSRVKKSQMLTKLDPELIRVQRVLFDLIVSEISFVTSIDLLVKHFVESPEIMDVLGKRGHHQLFSNIIEIQKFSRNLAAMLCQMWKDDCYLDPCLLAFVVEHYIIHNASVYHIYASSYKQQVEKLAEERKKAKFVTLLSRIHDALNMQRDGLDLLLLLPIRRVGTLENLLRAALDCSPTGHAMYKQLSACLHELGLLQTKCNDVCCQPVGKVQALAIDTDFRFKNQQPIPVTSGNGSLIKEGSLTCSMQKKITSIYISLYIATPCSSVKERRSCTTL